MVLQFTNRQIFFAVESIWPTLNYKFKFLLNEKVAANQADDFVQTIDVPENVLIDIYSAVTAKPEGVSSGINHETNQALLSQLMPLANLAAVQAQTEEPNEAARILIAVDKINNQNTQFLEAKILNGKTQILE
ncbi:MAG: hypothetical protein QM791_04055 [Ferruginibacter sp.]